MELLIWAFLAYNILTGIVLIIYFLTTGKKINSFKELLWLLFLPFIGLGKWHYINTRIDNLNELEYPEKWYIYKYMIKINKGFIIATAIATIVSVIYLSGFFGSGLDWAKKQDNMLSLSFGFLFDFGYLLLFSLIIGTLIFWMTISYLVLIMLPKNGMKNIENRLLREKLDRQQNQNKSADF